MEPDDCMKTTMNKINAGNKSYLSLEVKHSVFFAISLLFKASRPYSLVKILRGGNFNTLMELWVTSKWVNLDYCLFFSWLDDKLSELG